MGDYRNQVASETQKNVFNFKDNIAEKNLEMYENAVTQQKWVESEVQKEIFEMRDNIIEKNKELYS